VRTSAPATLNVKSNVQSSAEPKGVARPGAAALLSLLLLLALPLPAAAQGSWSVRGAAGEQQPVVESRARGFAALPLGVLEQLGGRVEVDPHGIRASLAGVEFTFRAGSPFFGAGGSVHQLVFPTYTSGDTLFLSVQFFTEHLPRLVAARVEVDAGERTLRLRPVADGAPVTGGAASAPSAAPAPPPAAAAPAPAPAPAAAARPPPSLPAPGRPSPHRRLVVIDAGHGGVDPGAIGRGGLREKEVTLAVSRQLAEILRGDTLFEVRMTRDRDTLIALTDRPRMANGWRREGQPAVFISVHTNAADNRTAHGFETYFLSEARTEDARRVAQMENAAQRFESPATRTLDPLAFILHDLRQNRYLRDSADWAAMIQRRLAAAHPGPNRGVKQAGFVVLNGAFMPAVLVELGFISNAEEEAMLRDPAQQRRMAQELANGIRDFFRYADATGIWSES
jgi:N-acetylmuramoyl-L-alanine amidase